MLTGVCCLTRQGVAPGMATRARCCSLQRFGMLLVASGTARCLFLSDLQVLQHHVEPSLQDDGECSSRKQGNVPPGNRRMSRTSRPCLEAHVLCSLVWCGCSFSIRDTNSLNTTSKSLLELEDFGVGLETGTELGW